LSSEVVIHLNYYRIEHDVTSIQYQPSTVTIFLHIMDTTQQMASSL